MKESIVQKRLLESLLSVLSFWKASIRAKIDIDDVTWKDAMAKESHVLSGFIFVYHPAA